MLASLPVQQFRFDILSVLPGEKENRKRQTEENKIVKEDIVSKRRRRKNSNNLSDEEITSWILMSLQRERGGRGGTMEGKEGEKR